MATLGTSFDRSGDLVPIGRADIKQSGSDVTLVAIAGAMRPALEAAKALAARGISVEVIDPRTLKPLDLPTIISSVVKAGRLVLVENAHRLCGVTAEIAATLAQYAQKFLRHILSCGFTSVRDVGGGDHGMAMALRDEFLDGPRFYYGGLCWTV